MKRSTRRCLILGAILTPLIVAVVVARLYLGVWVLDYVNRTLANIGVYQGSVRSIDVDLYRGAYRIHHLVINKKTGAIPVPFIAIDDVDLAIQWAALIHGRVVSNIKLEKPVINFAVNESDSQTGSEVDWTKTIKDLMPLDINRVTFNAGKLTYQDFSATPKVDIYIHNMSGEVRNLRNVVDKARPLPSTVVVTGDSIGGGPLDIRGRMNILKRIPDMDLNLKLEKVPLPALNSYSSAYAGVNFKKGELNIYSNFIVKNDQVRGYIKPIATNISLVDLRKESNPITVAWESVVSAVVTLFTNIQHDQFATRIELNGSLENINTNTWSAIGGIVHNAFVQAFTKGLDKKPAPQTLLPPTTRP